MGGKACMSLVYYATLKVYGTLGHAGVLVSTAAVDRIQALGLMVLGIRVWRRAKTTTPCTSSSNLHTQKVYVRVVEPRFLGRLVH